MEYLAKALAHFCLRSVSMIRRFNGVVDADDTNENNPYSNETPYAVPANRNENRTPAVTK
jgi:hypothetical protein